MKKTLLLALFVLLGVGFTLAQTKVTGTVTSIEDGKPLAFVTVAIKGTSTVSTTDNNGLYSINVPSGDATLVFSFVGMKAEEVAIGGRAVVDVVLEPDATQLDETVVIAYGVTKKSSLTGAAQVIKAESIEKTQSANISKALQGVASGVQVVMNTAQPGEAAKIRIRGVSSLNASQEPLWVVDGVPYDGLLNSINQDDIESMTVLKDAASAALYGARGANGVILVNTKKGKRGEPVIDFKATWGTSAPAIKEYRKLGALEHMQMEWEAFYNYNKTRDASALGGLTPEAFTSKYLVNDRTKYNPIFVNGAAAAEPIGTDGKPVAGYQLMWDEDWADALTRTPLRQEYQVSVKGGADKARYIISLGILDEQGVPIDSKFERYTGRASVDVDLRKWFTTGLSIAIANGKQNFPLQSSSSFINPYIFSRTASPIFPVYRHDAAGKIMYNEDGTPIYDTGDWQSSSSMYRPVASGSNPVAAIKYQATKYNNWSVDPTWYTTFTFTPWLSLKSTIAVNYYTNDSDDSYSRLLGDAKDLGRIYKRRNSQLALNANQLLTFNKTFADVHAVNVMLGHESSLKTHKYLTAQKTNTYDDAIPEFDMAITMATMSSRTDELAREGYFGRASYDYDGKYLLEGSYRRDASSRFHSNHRWGDFWSVSGAWRIIRENFMKDITFLSDLKLRASYGIQGNDGLSSWFAYQGLGSAIPYNSGSYTFAGQPGYYYSQLPNERLTWEKNATLNFGLDFGLFSNKVVGTIEYFHKTTTDMVFEMPLAPTTGFRFLNSNAGKLINKGVELELRADILRKKDFEIGTSFNISYIDSKIVSLPSKLPIIDGIKRWANGGNPYAYYTYEYAGVKPETGEALYYKDVVDDAGNPTGERTTVTSTASATKYVMGSALPVVTGAISPYFNGYGLDFSFTLSGEFGHKIYDSNYASLMHDGYRSGYTWSVDILNRWTEANKNTNVPKVQGSGSASQASVTSSRFLFNGDYLRLRSLTLGYTIPKKLTNKMGVKKLRVFFQGDNMLTFILGNVPKGTDPESWDGRQAYNSTASRIISGGLTITL